MIKNPFVSKGQGGGSFLPQDYVARKSELRANLLCMTLFGVVMFGVVGAFFVTNRQWMSVREEQRTVTAEYQHQAQQIEELKKLEDQKSSMLSKAEVTTALVEKVPRSILLAELVTRMPEDITLLEFELSSKRAQDAAPATDPKAPRVRSLAGASSGSGKGAAKGGASAERGSKARAGVRKGEPEAEQRPEAPRFTHTMRLVGVARVNNDIADYVTELKNCPLLENVELKFIKETLLDKVELRRFEIEATLKPGADGRGIEPVKNLRARAKREQPPMPAPPPGMEEAVGPPAPPEPVKAEDDAASMTSVPAGGREEER